MALVRKEVLDNGVELPEAYIRVLSVSSGDPKGSVELVVGVFKDAAARQADLRPVTVRRHTLPVPQKSGTFLGLMYEALKSIKQYEGAGDV